MDAGQIAGLIAAIAFAVLAGFMIYPLIRLGKLFDQIAETVKDTGDHAIPALDEGVDTVKKVNQSLTDVNDISSAVSSTTNNASALVDLYGSVLGKPVIKIASAAYAIKSTAQGFFDGMSQKKAQEEAEKAAAQANEEDPVNAASDIADATDETASSAVTPPTSAK